METLDLDSAEVYQFVFETDDMINALEPGSPERAWCVRRIMVALVCLRRHNFVGALNVAQIVRQKLGC